MSIFCPQQITSSNKNINDMLVYAQLSLPNWMEVWNLYKITLEVSISNPTLVFCPYHGCFNRQAVKVSPHRVWFMSLLKKKEILSLHFNAFV